MYASTKKPATTIATHCGQPSSASTTIASAYRLTPAMRIAAKAKRIELSRWAPLSKRSRRNSGTDLTLLP